MTIQEPRITFPVGVTHRVSAWAGGAVRSFGVSCDISAWTQPATLAIAAGYSLDNQASWLGAGGCDVGGTPPFINDDGLTVTTTGFGQTFRNPVTPTHIRWSATITGNPIPLGPTTVTVS